MCSNPCYNYITVSFDNGNVELLNFDSNQNQFKYISKMVMCDEELSSVKFFENGDECIVSSYPTGLFFYVHVSENSYFNLIII